MQNIKNIVKQINQLEKNIKTYSDEQIKNKTTEFRNQLKEGKTLEDILPEAFAIVREGARRVTGKRLYDVQLMGGYVLNQGRVAEIKAGEGKTLTESLPAYLNALEGKGVHIITTNEYLAKRDFNEIGKILEFLGLSVGLIYQGMDGKERKEAYKKDVTYGTNTEFGFDYLRDNIVSNKEEIVQRKLNYAIVDEADSILIDEAQTPMIISQKKYKTNPYPYVKANAFVKRLKGIRIIKEDPKDKEQLEENEQFDYVVDETYKTVDLTQKGIQKAEEEYNVQNYYDKKNKNIINDVKQALRANAVLKKDVDYIVKDEKVLLIDQYTGRIMYGKRFTRGLHEAIEAKEHLEIEGSSAMLANISTQNYFRMYQKLSGMTGTAKTSEKEFNDVYQLDVVKIPTNKKSQRVDKQDRIYVNEEEKNKAIIEEVKKSRKIGQPVLIGTTSIENSEKLSQMLKQEKIRHKVLNAKYHEEEAKIVEQVGRANEVTIATNMAGRGTNIVLGGTNATKKAREKVIRAGGLKVIGTERHEARRIDEQLRGRSGRQGAIGESIFYLSLDDELIKIYGNKKRIERYKRKKAGEVKSKRIKREFIKAQKEAENRNYTVRKRTIYYDGILNKQREIIYTDRREVLEGNTEKITKNFISYFCEELVVDNGEKAKRMIEKLEEAENIKIDINNIEELKEKIYKRYREKKKEIGEKEFIKAEKNKLLDIIDESWIEHLDIMEELRDNIELRAYGGHDPIEEYNKEGKKIFDELIDKIKMNTVSKLLFNTNYFD